MPAFHDPQHLWVTPYADDELYPAGLYPLEPNPVGIEQWTERNRSLVGKDLVLWHTMVTAPADCMSAFPSDVVAVVRLHLHMRFA